MSGVPNTMGVTNTGGGAGHWDEDRDVYVAKKPLVYSEKPNISPIYDFRDDETGCADIVETLEDSSLGIPDYYRWRSRSVCHFCFYQQVG